MPKPTSEYVEELEAFIYDLCHGKDAFDIGGFCDCSEDRVQEMAETLGDVRTNYSFKHGVD